MECFDVYDVYPITPVRGRGCSVYDAQGTAYLDFYGGHAVISVGHAHPRYLARLRAQMEELAFYSNAVVNPLQSEVARRLGALSGYDAYRLFLCNSGAEANENALKLASFHTGRDRVLAFRGAFHGRTSGALAATDNPRIAAPFNRNKRVDFVPIEDRAQMERCLATGRYAAAIVEGIQGVAGIRVPSDDFLQALRRATEASGTVLILDEIQSGYGRTGRFFAHQQSGIRPDLITVAKGMGNGFPIGGVLIGPAFEARKGMLGTTFGGNHLAAAAAAAVLEIIGEEHLVENARQTGDYLLAGLRRIAALKAVRGRGLMIGFDIEGSAAALRRRLLFDHRIFTGGAGEHTVRLLPPLTIGANEADRFLEHLETALR